MKALLVIFALPVITSGLLTLFLKLRFGLIKDGTKRSEALARLAGNY
jgi:hypothetical protein